MQRHALIKLSILFLLYIDGVSIASRKLFSAPLVRVDELGLEASLSIKIIIMSEQLLSFLWFPLSFSSFPVVFIISTMPFCCRCLSAKGLCPFRVNPFIEFEAQILSLRNYLLKDSTEVGSYKNTKLSIFYVFLLDIVFFQFVVTIFF